MWGVNVPVINCLTVGQLVASDTSDANRMACSKASKASTSGVPGSKRFDRFGRRVCECKLCKRTSEEASPLLSASPTDDWYGCVPWAKHVKASRMIDMLLVLVKDPDGKLCSICVNVYKILGLLYARWRLATIDCATPANYVLDIGPQRYVEFSNSAAPNVQGWGQGSVYLGYPNAVGRSDSELLPALVYVRLFE